MGPRTLQEAIVYFSDPARCREYLVARRWPDGVTCPRCGSNAVKFQPKYNRWQCAVHHDRRQFTLKTGTIFEDSPISLGKWLLAMWQVVNCRNGVSSYEIHRAIGVTQKTAWFMDHRIRMALGMSESPKLSGEVEIDETFIGGKSRNMHKRERARKIHGTGGGDKEIAMGMIERGGEVRVMHVGTRRKGELQKLNRETIEADSAIFSDALKILRRIRSRLPACRG
jgi:transposase-like protein